MSTMNCPHCGARLWDQALNCFKCKLPLDLDPGSTSKIHLILRKYKKLFHPSSGVYFFDQIPDKKLTNAKTSYAAIKPNEKPLVLRDDGRGGKKGYVFTDRRLYFSEKNRTYYWTDLNDVQVSHNNLFINGEFMMMCYITEDFYWSQFLMIHEIFRNMVGESVSLSVSKPIVFPRRCIGCLSEACDKTLSVPILGHEEFDMVQKVLPQFGIIGTIAAVGRTVVLGEGKVRKTVVEYSIPICKKCFSELGLWEKGEWTVRPLTWDESSLKSFYANRHMAIELDVKMTGNALVNMWFREFDFAEEFRVVNNLQSENRQNKRASSSQDSQIQVAKKRRTKFYF